MRPPPPPLTVAVALLEVFAAELEPARSSFFKVRVGYCVFKIRGGMWLAY